MIDLRYEFILLESEIMKFFYVFTKDFCERANIAIVVKLFKKKIVFT